MSKSSIVCDASLLLATVLEENQSQKAKALLRLWEQQDIQLAAPHLLHYEIVAVLRRNVFQRRLTADEGRRAHDVLLAHPVDLYFDDTLLKRAYDLATQFNRPTAYDAQYLALAERLECEFWTADERLFNAVHESLEWVNWVGNFEYAGQ